ncbi:hypothetical protein dqs_2222 [Azoarcus olearius]|uniref:PilN domain-containing protein n=1 Tax=Azoarcus sp. (strain BH72) TaxID=418699 RepID=UPI0008061F4E|nr:PilN domain-containing protein [Azoarcus olearius]ANQ85256.1 hypothetical protein dqs_2222 [Azoarcus olearius]
MSACAVPRALALDFVPVARRNGAVSWTLLAVGAACSVLAMSDYSAGRDELAARERTLAGLRAARRDAPRAVAAPLAPAEREAWQRISGRLTADWSGIFAALARVRDGDVAWLEVGVEAEGGANGGLRLTGQARSLDAVFVALARVAAEPALAGAVLVSHEAVVADGVPLVRFTLMTTRRGGV